MEEGRLKPGDEFERYTIEAAIGHGGMGNVYRAHDARLGRRVALKVISSERAVSTDAGARLMREARAAAALDHPNAVAIFDVGEREGTPFIVMELVEGQPLRSLVGQTGVLLSARIRHLADIGRALGSAHKRGLVHRDVKPENVMVRTDGMVKVLDFGIARRTGGDVDPSAPTQAPALPTLTIDGAKLGTPLYMAPEQIRGDALDGRTDQFSWAVVAYELLSGQLPWRGGDALAAMASALTEKPNLKPLEESGVPKGVQRVILRALSKDREDRYSTMEEAVAALEAAARGEAVEEPDPPPQTATSEQRFSTSEVREVLAKAIDGQAAKQGSTKLGFEDLLAVAAEVGVDPESIREASRALRKKDEASADPKREGPDAGDRDALVAADGYPLDAATAARRDAWIRRRKRGFSRHAGVFVIVNIALLVLGLFLLPFSPWWVWFIPGLFWAIGLAIHGMVALGANEDDWRESEARTKWWREERRRRHEESIAWGRGRGYRDLPQTIVRGIAANVAASLDKKDPKLRVAPPTGSTTDNQTGDQALAEAAEQEAARAEAEAQQKRGKRR